MTNLPNSLPSPRITDGVLRWYKGDTFELTVTIDLTDQDDAPVDIKPSDILTIAFSKEDGIEIHTFEFTNIIDATVTLGFTQAISDLFDTGCYAYTVTLNSERVITLARESLVVVE